ncbi:MAG: Hsp20/alpha crystallin family protein [Bacillota bacterium]|nr:Hsp20/alpha crystallin family protein [Bacillota bacterium]
MFGLTPSFRKQNSVVKGNNIWDINSVFEQFFNDSFLTLGFTNGQAIKADIRENDKEYIVEAEVPGVNKEDIKLELSDDTLSISVNHKVETEEKTDNYVRRERQVGSFTRSFYVENVVHDKVTAKHNNGILTITLPKGAKKEKANRIDIQ